VTLRNDAWTANSWGHPDKYQSISAFKAEKKDRKLLARMQDIEKYLKARDPELPEKVERTFKQWNLIIRDYLRNETALRLSVGDDTQNVPVRIVAGFPRPFEDIIIYNDVELMILLNRPSIVNTTKGMQFLDQHFDTLLDQGFVDPDTVTYDEVKRVKAFADRIAMETERLAVLNRIRSIEDDILGAYFYRIPVIHLYWMVIGTIAAMLDVSVEALTVVVTAHELAHAYSHCGKDIDGEKWKTDSFAKADLKIIEGIAQFYTQIMCEKLFYRVPAALSAYKKLLDFQSEPYVIHKSWIKDSKVAGEIIRGSMIECRSRDTTDYKSFEEIVDRHRKSIVRPTK